MALFAEIDKNRKPWQHSETSGDNDVEITDIRLEDALEYFGLASKMAERATLRTQYEARLSQLGDVDFTTALQDLVATFPPSSYRDTLIEALLQKMYTTWEDIDTAGVALNKKVRGKGELSAQLAKVNTTLSYIPLLLFPYMQRSGNTLSLEEMLNSFADSLGFSIDIEDAASILQELQEPEGTMAQLEHLSNDEILMAPQDLLLGNYGLLKNKSFELYGEGLLQYVFSIVEDATTDPFFLQHKDVIVSTTFLALKGLSPERRAGVLLEMLRSFQKHSGSELLWQHIVVDVLMKFVSGTKLLQMDVFLPKEFKLLAMAAKENMPPTSKFFVRDVLRESDRQDHYVGIGPCRAAASTATVHPLAAAEDEPGEYRVVMKTIHEHAEKYLEEEFEAFGTALRYFVSELGAQLNVDAVLQELQTVVHRELDPSIESENTKQLRKIREEHDDGWVQVPEIIHASNKHIEMNMAPGFSLQTLLEGNVPEHYREIKWKQVCFVIVRDYFKQVFDFGVFNADEHSGNVFVHLRSAMRRLLKKKNPDEVPPVTVIDHGSVGFVASPERKKAMFLFGLGFELQDKNMVAEALLSLLISSEDDLDASIPSSQSELVAQLDGMKGTLFENALEILVLSGKGADVMLYSKGLASLFPLLEELSLFDKIRIAMPYVRKLGLESSVIKKMGTLSRSVLQNTFLGTRSRVSKEGSRK